MYRDPTRIATFPRARLDALTDGIYAVAMTLLALDVHLPEDAHIHSAADLLQAMAGLWTKLLPYVLSFYVLGLRWLASVEARGHSETVTGGAYIRWWMLGLALICLVPFSTTVLGRYAYLAPAIWLYAGNMALLGLVSWGQFSTQADAADDRARRHRRISALVLLAASLLCIAISLVAPERAPWAFVLCATTPWVARRVTRVH